MTVVDVALPEIGRELGSDGPQWVVDGYAVALAALLLDGTAVGAVRSSRPGSACSVPVPWHARSHPAPVSVAARIGQSLGAAMLLPGTLAIIS